MESDSRPIVGDANREHVDAVGKLRGTISEGLTRASQRALGAFGS